MIFKQKAQFYKGNNFFALSGTIAIVSFSFFVTAAIFLVSQNVGHLLNTFGENIQASVYLRPNTSVELSDKFLKQILSEPNIKKAEFIDPSSAIIKLSNSLDGLTQDLIQDPELIAAIPASIEVTFKSESFSSEFLKNFANNYKNNEIVEEITYGQQWLESYSNIVLGFKKIGVFFISFMLLSCVLIVSRSIRSAVLEKRNQIEVLELVGATRSFIRRPFIKEGLAIGFLSSVSSLVLCYLGLQAVISLLSGQNLFQNTIKSLQFFNWTFLITYLIFCVVFSGLISWWTVRKVNSGWLAASYGELGQAGKDLINDESEL